MPPSPEHPSISKAPAAPSQFRHKTPDNAIFSAAVLRLLNHLWHFSCQIRLTEKHSTDHFRGDKLATQDVCDRIIQKTRLDAIGSLEIKSLILLSCVLVRSRRSLLWSSTCSKIVWKEKSPPWLLAERTAVRTLGAPDLSSILLPREPGSFPRWGPCKLSVSGGFQVPWCGGRSLKTPQQACSSHCCSWQGISGLWGLLHTCYR